MALIVNTGRLINFLTGITGVTPGGTATINLDLNKRYHRIVFQCKAVNYTGGTARPSTKITGSGTGATVTPTIVNGVVTSAAVVSGGSGYTVGDQITFTDATGQGAVLTVATVSTGAIATLTVASGGTPSPINPASLITSVRISVNGITLRDITPANIVSILSAVDPIAPTVLQLGELPIYFTEPARNKNGLGELTAWDMFGQSTFQVLLGISSTAVTPMVMGFYEFDYARNATANGTPFLQPITQRQFSLPIPAGRYDVNTLPFSWPISRVWLSGSTPGQITQVEVYQDGNKVLEMTTDQIQQAYGEYGFNLGTGFGTNSPVAGSFDAAFIADPDQNLGRALKCANAFSIRVYSNVAQTLNIVQEMTPSAYAS
jgi:hypothetical protein